MWFGAQAAIPSSSEALPHGGALLRLAVLMAYDYTIWRAFPVGAPIGTASVTETSRVTLQFDPTMTRSNMSAREIFEEVKANPARARFGFGSRLAVVNV